MEKFICGLDEAGRGPLAGPVLAGCVILPSDFDTSFLKDSKKLSEKKRLTYEKIIKENAVAWSVSSVSHKIIDEINILQASLLAMKQAFEKLHTKDGTPYSVSADFVSKIIVDGLYKPDIFVCGVPCCAVVKADNSVPSVMAAAILAKNERDRIMLEYDKLYPKYQYFRHKGYPTPLHKELCHKYGASPIQRMSFKY